MKFDYKVFKVDGEVLVAIADSSVIGKSFAEGEMEIKVTKEFYSGRKCDEKEAVKLVKKATIVNVVGSGIVSLLVKKGFVDEDKIITIQKTPHAQIVVIK